ncbi:hypothetical protein RCL1_007250 [Eukaryota sp. TZLM3-RCL]
MNKFLLILAFCFLLCCARSHGNGLAVKCAEDLERFCSDEQGPKIFCLARVLSELTPDCATKVSSALEFHHNHPCHEDRSKHCADEKGEHNINRCLAKQQKHVGRNCQHYLREVAIKFNSEECLKHRTLLCNNERTKYGMLQCLYDNREQLPPFCVPSLAQLAASEVS